MERPDRYKSREVNGMDVIDLVNHWGLNFSQGNILKYLLRDKGEDLSDMKKIIQYAQREVERMEGNHIDDNEAVEEIEDFPEFSFDDKAMDLCRGDFISDSDADGLDILNIFISSYFNKDDFKKVCNSKSTLPFTNIVYYAHGSKDTGFSYAYYPYKERYIVIKYKNDVSF